MITSKIIFLVYLLTLVASVLSDDYESVNTFSVRNLLRPRPKFLFNHPPAAENDDTIPVVILLTDSKTVSKKMVEEPETEMKIEDKSEDSVGNVEVSTESYKDDKEIEQVLLYNEKETKKIGEIPESEEETKGVTNISTDVLNSSNEQFYKRRIVVKSFRPKYTLINPTIVANKKNITLSTIEDLDIAAATESNNDDKEIENDYKETRKIEEVPENEKDETKEVKNIPRVILNSSFDQPNKRRIFVKSLRPKYTFNNPTVIEKEKIVDDPEKNIKLSTIEALGNTAATESNNDDIEIKKNYNNKNETRKIEEDPENESDETKVAITIPTDVLNSSYEQSNKRRTFVKSFRSKQTVIENENFFENPIKNITVSTIEDLEITAATESNSNYKETERKRSLLRLQNRKYKLRLQPASAQQTIPVAIVYDKVIDKDSRAEKNYYIAKQTSKIEEDLENQKNDTKESDFENVTIPTNKIKIRYEQPERRPILLKSFSGKYKNNDTIAIEKDKIVEDSAKKIESSTSEALKLFTATESSKETNKILGSLRLQKLKFNNRPRLANNERIIPVAIVYDKEIDKNSRAEKTANLAKETIKNEEVSGNVKDTTLESITIPTDEFKIKYEQPERRRVLLKSLRPKFRYNNTISVERERINDPTKNTEASLTENPKLSTATKRNNETEKTRGSLRLQKFRYNTRPQPVNTEQVIPVAIVYDKEIDRNNSAGKNKNIGKETSKTEEIKLKQSNERRTFVKSLRPEYTIKNPTVIENEKIVEEPEKNTKISTIEDLDMTITTESNNYSTETEKNSFFKVKYSSSIGPANYENKIPVAIVYDDKINENNRTEQTPSFFKGINKTKDILGPTDVPKSSNKKPKRKRIFTKKAISNYRTIDLPVAEVEKIVPAVYNKELPLLGRTVELKSETKQRPLADLKESNNLLGNTTVKYRSQESQNTKNKELMPAKTEGSTKETIKEVGDIVEETKIITKPNVDQNLLNQSRFPQGKQLRLQVKVPVSVVYDKEPDAVQSPRTQSGVVTRVLRKSRKLKNDSHAGTELKTQTPTKTANRIILNTHDFGTTVRSVDRQPPFLKETTTETPAKIYKSTVRSAETKNKNRQRDPIIVPIIQSENKVFAQNGAFEYSYEGGDGTKAYSNGILKTFAEDKTGEAVVGGFSYKDKDGNDFSLSYTADENGYRPVGAHLPTPPPIPPAIARALEYLATKSTPEPVTETSLQIKNKKQTSNK